MLKQLLIVIPIQENILQMYTEKDNIHCLIKSLTSPFLQTVIIRNYHIKYITQVTSIQTLNFDNTQKMNYNETFMIHLKQRKAVLRFEKKIKTEQDYCYI